MKRFLTTIAIVLLAALNLNAQSYGYVNTQEILEKMPEYRVAQDRLDRIREDHEADMKSEMERIEMLFRKYQSEKSRLSDAVRQSRENEIIMMERNAKERQREIFGQEGSFSKLTLELMEPIQRRVQTAIDSVSIEMGLGIVFDINAMQGVLYKNPRLDITARVMNKLNLK